MKYGIEEYGLYFACVEIIAGALTSEHATFELEHDAEVLAHKFKVDTLRVEEIMKYMVSLNLFQINDETGHIVCYQLLKRLDVSTGHNPEFKKLLSESISKYQKVLPAISRLDYTRLDKTKLDNIYIVQFEELWKQYPKAIGKKEALKHFTASVKTPEDLDNIKKALTNYSQSKRVKDGYVQNGSTWFNNWTDWINFKEVGKDKHGFISKDCDVEKTKEQLRKEGFRVAD